MCYNRGKEVGSNARQNKAFPVITFGVWQHLVHGAHGLLEREVYEDAPSFSGGELQRLMLARALYKDAPIILLDEPTAALDPVAEYEIYSHFDQLIENKTAIYISHRLSSTRFCDRVLLIDQGRIAEEGTHEQLLAQGGRYAELFRLQSHYYQKGDEPNEET